MKLWNPQTGATGGCAGAILLGLFVLLVLAYLTGYAAG